MTNREMKLKLLFSSSVKKMVIASTILCKKKIQQQLPDFLTEYIYIYVLVFPTLKETLENTLDKFYYILRLKLIHQ